jgi:Holliday junction resolvase-like predicted endonuclease
MGYLFERIVCLHYEAHGYLVKQRAGLGFRDQGVDLIANAPGERIFVQCKFTMRSIGPQQVERLLWAASKFIRDHRCSGENFFDLVVPCTALAFPVKRPAGRSAALHAFMRHNELQRQVALRLVEVPLPLPEHMDVQPTQGC